MARLRTCKNLSILVALALVLALGAVAVALALAPAMVVNAADIQVTNNNDSGAGSLRQAIADVGIGDEITFADNVTGTITLTSGALSISENLTITGPGADVLTISGNNASRVFIIGSGVVTISGLTIRNGSAPFTGGGIGNDGTLTLTNCTIRDNTSGSMGGGIFNEGTLTLDNSTVSDNSAWLGGGIYNIWGTLTLNNCTVSGNIAAYGGGIYNGDTLILNNCTVSDNTANNGDGGGILNLDTITLNNSTFSNNTATGSGGGVHNAYGAANVKNSIIAGNNASSGLDFYGTLTSYGCNLVEDTSDCSITGDETCNIYNEDPLLGPLQDNGGPTFTHALLKGSPSIDGVCTDCGCTTVDGTPVTTDQRGEPRPADGDADGTALCDIGAYELQPAPCPPGVPTVNHWGIVAIISLFVGLLVWAVHRRRLAS